MKLITRTGRWQAPSAEKFVTLDTPGTMQADAGQPEAGKNGAAERAAGLNDAGSRYARALDLIERCAAEQNAPALVDEFLATVALFGFCAGAGGAWTGMGRTRAYRFYFNTWPADWLALYNARGVFFDDPIVAEAQRRMAPFLWADLEHYRPLHEVGTEIRSLVYEYGWADGLVVPVHGPSGYQGVVSLAAMQKLELSGADISLLWVMALAAHARCRESLGMGSASAPPPKLTKREGQCMQWVAAGKTDWEIGALLEISPATVHFHVERVKRRLAATSRTEAVALLVLHGAL
jgi:LuxR family quorum sensing-dependent transcriptional regulator